MKRRLTLISDELPVTYTVSKWYVVLRASLSIVMMLSLCLFWLEQSQLILRVIIFLTLIWVFHLNVEYVRGLLRLGDAIILTRDGLAGKVLGKEVFAKWGEVVRAKIAVNYWDGICFVITLRGGEKIVFTEMISDSLDAYNRISRRLQQNLK